MKETGNKTAFTGQPLELECGQWRANDSGVTMMKCTIKGALTHERLHPPILPVEILKNVDNSEERVPGLLILSMENGAR